MNAVLEWVKANVFIVVFAALMVAASAVLPYFSSRMNASLREDVTQRAANLSKLAQLEKVEILPGQTGVVTDQTLRRYEEVAKVMAEDAAKVQNTANEHNRKARGILLDSMFPEPPPTRLDVMPKRFHEALLDGYGTLLARIKAGMPPSLESLRQELDRQRIQFVTVDLKKDTSETLTPEEQVQLREKLTNARMSAYASAAGKIGLYVSTDQLGVPEWNQSSQPTLDELFMWQWQYWVIEDILLALDEANKAESSVLQAPVKRVVSLSVLDLPSAGDGGRRGPGGGASGSTSMGFGSGANAEGMGGGGGASSAQGGGAPANPKAPLARDYNASFTGRVSNGLYDVVNVDVTLIVETSRLPQVLDSLAKYNFITVTGLTLRSADPFVDVQDGFFYGSAPASQVAMTLETIWLRAWTKDFMPNSVKEALGIPVAPAMAGAASDSET